MPKFERLELINGDFILVEAPTILVHARVRALQVELHSSLLGLNVLDSGVDLEIYPIYKNYYQHIGDLLTPRVLCDELVSKSRHEFFVCTAPYIASNGEEVLGLSKLETLMGYSQDTSPVSEIGKKNDSEIITTGDNLLDIIADSLLIFKKNAFNVFKTFSLEDTAAIALQASQRMQQAQSEASESDKTKNNTSSVVAPSIDSDSTSTAPSNEVQSALSDLNINLPPI